MRQGAGHAAGKSVLRALVRGGVVQAFIPRLRGGRDVDICRNSLPKGRNVTVSLSASHLNTRTSGLYSAEDGRKGAGDGVAAWERSPARRRRGCDHDNGRSGLW